VPDALSYMVSIDAQTRGLDDLNKKLERTNAAIPKTDIGLKKLSSTIGGMVVNVGNANGAIATLGGATAESLGAGAAAAGALAGGIGLVVAAAGAAVFATKKFTDAIIDAAADDERGDLAFKLRFGEEGAKNLLGWIERINHHTEFTKNQLEGWTLELGRAGITASEMDTFIAAAGDLAAMSGDKVGGMSAAISALSRASLTGKLEGRTLMGLGIGVRQLQQLPEFSGKTEKQLTKVMTEGNLTKNQVLRIIAGADGMLGDSAVEAGNTLEAKLKNLRELPKMFFETFKDSAAFEKLKGLLDVVFDKFNPEGEQGQRLMATLGTVFDRLGSAIEKVDIDQLSRRFGDFLDTGLRVIGGVYEAAGAFASFASWASRAYESVKPLVDVVRALANPLDAILRLRSGDFGEAGKEAFGAGANLVSGFAAGISSAVGSVKESIVGIGTSAIGSLKNALGIRSPSVVFRGLGQMTGAGFIQGLESSLSTSSLDAAMGGALAVEGPSTPRRLAGGVLGGPVSVALELNVNVGAGGGDAREQGDIIAARVRDILPSALMSAFDLIRAEQGA
jgi:hypothetical protein